MTNIILIMILMFLASKLTIFNIIEKDVGPIVRLMSFNIGSSGEAIALRLEVIASRLEAIALRLEAIAPGLEAIATGLEASATGLEAIASRPSLLGWRQERIL